MRHAALFLTAAALTAGETVVVPLAVTPIFVCEDISFSWTMLRGGKTPVEQALWWAGRAILFQWRDGKLHWDANQDMRIDEADGGPLAEGDGITLSTALGGGQVQVPLRVSLQLVDIELFGGLPLVGTWAGRRIALIDRDVDGRWDTFDSDVLLQEVDGVWTVVDDLRRRMLIDGAIWTLEVDHTAPALRLTREEAVMTTATVTGGDLAENYHTFAWLSSAERRISISLNQAKAPVDLPVGTYDLDHAGLRLDGIEYMLDRAPPYRRVEVKPGVPTQVVLQAPQHLEAVVVASGDGGIIIDSLALAADDGLRWRASASLRSLSLRPTWSLRGAGREQPLGKLEYG